MKAKLEVGDIRIFTLTSMLELIGKVEEVNDDHYVLGQVLMIRVNPEQGPDGRPSYSAAMGPVSFFIDKDDTSQASNVTLYYSNILGEGMPQEGILASHAEMTGSIMTPPAKSIQMP